MTLKAVWIVLLAAAALKSGSFVGMKPMLKDAKFDAKPCLAQSSSIRLIGFQVGMP
jgi:hypothetical protein